MAHDQFNRERTAGPDFTLSITARSTVHSKTRTELRELSGRLAASFRDQGMSPPLTTLSDDEIEATFSINAADLVEALGNGLDLWEKLATEVTIGDWEIVRVEAATEAMVDRELASSSIPPLVGVKEIAQLLGVSKQRVSKLKDDERFPRPVAYLASGPVWTASSTGRFLEEWARVPGRRPTVKVLASKPSTGRVIGVDELIEDVASATDLSRGTVVKVLGAAFKEAQHATKGREGILVPALQTLASCYRPRSVGKGNGDEMMEEQTERLYE